jgi:hypothetical protein
VDNPTAAKAAIAVGNDRISTYGWKALAGSVIGYSMDGFDMLDKNLGLIERANGHEGHKRRRQAHREHATPSDPGQEQRRNERSQENSRLPPDAT